MARRNYSAEERARVLAYKARTGRSNKDVAEKFQIPRSTVATWVKNRELRDAPVVAPPAQLPVIDHYEGNYVEPEEVSICFV